MIDENEVLTNDQINDLIKIIANAAGDTSDGRKLINSEEVDMMKALIRLQVEKTGIEYRGYKYRTPEEVNEFDEKYGKPE